jgi:mannose-1-phosphate guanylyltransferase
MIYSVIMVGGSGTRLWPVSRARRPKQTLRIGGADSLLVGTWKRARALSGEEGVIFVATAKLGGVIRGEVPGLPEGALVLEPEGRDTAACIGLAAVHVMRCDPEGVCVVMPADHLIRPVEKFVRVARTAAEVAERERCLVTMGIVPRSPATGYGYIHRAGPLADGYELAAYRVAAFREKPDQATARAYVDSGEYYWNSGIFAWRADVILAEMAKHLPDHHARLLEIASCIGSADETEACRRSYSQMERISVDYGVMEKAEEVAVVEADFSWDDVGSWTAYAEHIRRDADGNDVEGELIGVDCTDNIVVAPREKPVAAVGVKGMVIIDTPDVLFICPRSRDQDVKRMVEKLKGMGREELL